MLTKCAVVVVLVFGFDEDRGYRDVGALVFVFDFEGFAAVVVDAVV